MSASYDIYNPAPFGGKLVCICCNADKGTAHEEDCEISKLEKRIEELEEQVKELSIGENW